MKTVVVYESVYGNTHQVAECIAEVARTKGEVMVVPVSGKPGTQRAPLVALTW